MKTFSSLFHASHVGSSLALVAMGVALGLPLSASAQSYRHDYDAQRHTQPQHTRHRHESTVCRNVRVEDRPRDDQHIAGTAIGAIAGGLIGNQVGHGNGRTLATVAGAVGGGYAGNRIQAHQQARHWHYERRCYRK